MECKFSSVCGGCCFRDLSLIDYQQSKVDQVRNVLKQVKSDGFDFEEPVFISDGCRRRASLAFARHEGKIVMGFNAAQSKEIVDLDFCPMLTPKINESLNFVRQMLGQLADVNISLKDKRKKNKIARIEQGDVWITEADNGLDVVLEFDFEPNLEMRQIIFEMMVAQDKVVRISHRKNVNQRPETIMEKIKPYLHIAGREVYIPAGTFLQPSKAGEQALIALVNKYLGDVSGNIADLFCGVGTFSYALAQRPESQITAVDSSSELLSGFQESLNKQMISNIKIENRNLFKYPLSGKELFGYNAILFDPPRAGAKEQVSAIANLNNEQKPSVVVAVSCNPHSFVRDANILIDGGYKLKSVTMVDQFVYSAHSELAALFKLKN